jgi:hypothetical protein
MESKNDHREGRRNSDRLIIVPSIHGYTDTRISLYPPDSIESPYDSYGTGQDSKSKLNQYDYLHMIKTDLVTIEKEIRVYNLEVEEKKINVDNDRIPDINRNRKQHGSIVYENPSARDIYDDDVYSDNEGDNVNNDGGYKSEKSNKVVKKDSRKTDNDDDNYSNDDDHDDKNDNNDEYINYDNDNDHDNDNENNYHDSKNDNNDEINANGRASASPIEVYSVDSTTDFLIGHLYLYLIYIFVFFTILYQ